MKDSGGRRYLVLVPFAAAFIMLPAGCRQTRLSVHRIITERQVHDGKVVVVSGCFRTGRETASLQPMERVIPGLGHGRSTRTETLSPKEAEDYRRLMSGNWPKPMPVTLRGEFQSSDVPRFGHLNGFRYQLILYKVISFR